MNNPKTVILALSMLCIAAVAGAQTPPAAATNSAGNVSSLQGNSSDKLYNTDLFTGIANVSIPIYDYKVDGLDLGVSLSYNTKGIAVDQIASTVGLNWSLNSNCYIERTVYGMEDETALPPLLDNNNNVVVPKWYGQWVIGNIDSQYNQEKNSADLFTAVLADKTIQFTIEYPGKVVAVYPKSEVQIKVTLDGVDKGTASMPNDIGASPTYHVPGFIITDEHGNEYTFERADYEYHTYTAPGASTNWVYYPAKNWHVTQIKTYTGAIVKYTYSVNANLAYSYSRNCKVRETTSNGSSNSNNAGIVEVPPYNYAQGGFSVDSSDNKWDGTCNHISKIEYPNGTVVNFNQETDHTKMRCDVSAQYVLNSISVVSGYDANTTNTLTYLFNYSYFHAPFGTNTQTEIPYLTPCNTIANSYGLSQADGVQQGFRSLRLKLNSIDILGTDGTAKERYYTFEYNTTPLPPRLSAGQDYFGYANGKTPVALSYYDRNNTLQTYYNLSVPLHSYNLTINGYNNSGSYGVDKTPDLNYKQACMLTKITNGYGGSKSFYYKEATLTNPNTGNDPNPSPDNRYGGNAFDGLIIDKIVTNDGYNSDNSTTTQYTYSGGMRIMKGAYYWSPTIVKDFSLNATPVSPVEIIYSNTPVNPQTDYNGSNHGFSDVTEEVRGYNNQLISKNEYGFSNMLSNFPYNNNSLLYTDPNSMIGPATRFDKHKMGLLLSLKQYNSNSDLVSDAESTYQESYAVSPAPTTSATNTSDFSYSYINGFGNYEPHDDIVAGITYFKVATMNLVQTVTTTYTGSTQSVATVTNTYDANDNLGSTAWKDSKGADYTSYYGYSPTGEHQTYMRTVKNIGGAPYCVNMNVSVAPGIGYNYNDFQSLKSADPVPDQSASGYETINKHFTFDDHVNVIETSYDNNKEYGASIWDNRIGQRIAAVSNAKYSQIAYTSFEGSFPARGTADYNKGNWDFDPANIEYTTATSTPKAMTGHYIYHITSPANAVTSTIIPESGKQYRLTFWSYNGAKANLGSSPLTVAMKDNVVGWTLNEVIFTGDGTNPVSVLGSLSTSRVDELRLCPVESIMTTCTYEPLLGVGSACNEHNDIIYYQYDAMGRAKVVRDIEGNIISFTRHTVQGGDN